MFTYDVLEVTKKDSLDLTDDDRQKILDAVRSAQSDHIVITHGTDTLIKTAEMLSTLAGKTIVLTGSMLPEKFSHSDAGFNVGMAVAAVQSLAPGVYIALYGRVVPWPEFAALNQRYEEQFK